LIPLRPSIFGLRAGLNKFKIRPLWLKRSTKSVDAARWCSGNHCMDKHFGAARAAVIRGLILGSRVVIGVPRTRMSVCVGGLCSTSSLQPFSLTYVSWNNNNNKNKIITLSLYFNTNIAKWHVK